MDSNDEEQIKNALHYLSRNTKSLIDQNNKQVFINDEILKQIKDITKQVNNQQTKVSNFLSNFSLTISKNIATIEEELQIIQQLYQINYSIDLLNHHINEIEQVLLTSKLRILSRNIMTDKELNFISNIETYRDIKVVVAYYSENNQIIIVLLIPKYNRSIFSEILIEPIPNSNNKAILLENYKFLMNDKGEIFNYDVKENLELNLVKIDNDCVQGIFAQKKANCQMQNYNIVETKELTNGLVITKNINETLLIQNCNKFNIFLSGSNLIKFKNCKLNISNKKFENFQLEVNEPIILPLFDIKINESNKYDVIKLEEIHLKQIKNNRNEILDVKYSNKRNIILYITTNILIILAISILIYKFVYKKLLKHLNDF